MQLKVFLNTINIVINSKNSNFYDRYIKSIAIILVSPFIICISILIDFLTLPKIFWKNEEFFEEKYQKNMDDLSDV